MSAPASKPGRGRRIASALAGCVAAVALAWGAWSVYAEVASHAAQHVVFTGDADRLAPEDLARLEQAILASPRGSVESWREQARRIAWVREATVRRVYPDSVEVAFSAYAAFARWNDDRLVSPAGEVFAAQPPGPLPQLRGPEGTAARLVQEYPRVAAALAALGALRELRLSARGGWHARLDSGLDVALGGGEWAARAERFAAAWAKLPEEARATTYADLRYPGGFALSQARGTRK